MTLNIFAFRCGDNSSFNISNFLLCGSRKKINRIELIRLPDDINVNKLFDQPLKEDDFIITCNKEKEIISVDYFNKHSTLLGLDLSKIRNKNFSELKKIYKSDVLVIEIIEELINNCLENKKFTAVIFDKYEQSKYIVCSYPIMGDDIYGVFIHKTEYNEGFYSSNIF